MSLLNPNPKKQALRLVDSVFNPLPPGHIKVNALEMLQRHANRWEADTRAGRPTVENPNPPIVRTFPQRQRAAATTAQSGKKVAA